MPEELWTEVCNIVQVVMTKMIRPKKKCKKAKWLSEEALQIAEKRREVKGNGERERRKENEVSQSRLTFCDPMTVAHQALLSMEFFRQEYWSGLLFPSPGDCPIPGIKPTSPALASRFFTIEPCGKPDLLL